jgi:hypothetical protein
VRERHVPQPLQRHHLANGVADERELRAQAGVEQQRLLVDDEELVVREIRLRHRDADAIDAVFDLVDGGTAL